MFPCRRSTVAVDAACPVVALSAGPRGEIACISARRVSIWTCGPQLALIGSVDRQPFELGVLGANVGLCWHPDGTRLAVLTACGGLRVHGPATAATSRLSVRADLRVEPGCDACTCCAADGSAIVVAGRDGCLRTMSWEGEALQSAELNTSAELLAIALGREAGAVLIALVVRTSGGGGDGERGAVLLRGSSAQLDRAEWAAPVVLERRGACCVAVGVGGAVAVGCENGEVRLHSVVRASDDAVPTLSLRPWGHDPARSGAVASLAFAATGEHLAVGWDRRGAAIFSVIAGSLCAAWPGPSDADADAADADDAADDADADTDVDAACVVRLQRVACVCWVRGDAALVAAEHSTGAPRLWRLGLLRRGGAAGTVAAAGRDDLLLVGADHALLARVTATSPTRWLRVSPPPAYLHASYPLRLATLSQGGAHLAVSGAEGVAVVALRTERWRRFDGWAAEALRWLTADVLLVVGREVPRRSSAGDGDGSDVAGADLPPLAPPPHAPLVILALARNSLRAASAVGRAECAAVLDGPVWGCVAAEDGGDGGSPSLAVGAGRCVALYTARVSGKLAAAGAGGGGGGGGGGAAAGADGERLSVRLALARVVSLPGGAPRPVGLALLLPAAAGVDVDDSANDGAGGGGGARGRLTLAVADVSGALLLGSVGGGDDGGASVRPLVAMQVLPPGTAERWWAARGVVWAHGARGVFEWRWRHPPPTDSAAAPPQLSGRRVTACQPEVVPLAVLPAPHAAVVGASGVLAAGGGASIGPRVEAEPFAHEEIRRLLRCGARHAALRLARAAPFRRRRCLELALVGALADADADAADGVSAVVALLRQLGDAEWSAVVAQSARRMDAAEWPALFGACGAPLELLHAAKDAGALHAAALLLLPARAVHGDGDCLAAARELRCEVGALGETALVASIDEYVSRITGLDQNR